jgi:hypothetical protein
MLRLARLLADIQPVLRTETVSGLLLPVCTRHC